MAENKIKVLADRDDIVAIANAIRTRTGDGNAMTLGGIVSGIGGITGGENLDDVLDTQETKLNELITILENKASGGGESVIESIEITKNGTYSASNDVDGYSPVVVNVEPNLQNKTVTPTTSKQTISADNNYDGLNTVTVNAMPTTTQATPSITVNSNGLITATATQAAGYVTAGTKSGTKQLTVQAAQTITPTTTDQTAIASGVYATGKVTVKGDANLIPENIVSGTTIFGVVGSAEVGGGSETEERHITEKDVNFYDYEGTLLYSYTLEEAQALASLPALPTRQGLTCQGWNYDLATIKSYNRPVNVGAVYITSDGKTRLHIRIPVQCRMSVPLFISQTVANGVTIDWGDGSLTQTLSGTGYVNTTHDYANIGDYVITLTVADGCTLGLGKGTTTYCVLGENSTKAYCNMLQKVELGSGIRNIASSAFRFCYSLQSINIPMSVTSIGNYAFYGCHSLINIVVPEGINTMGTSVLQDCRAIQNIILPNSITTTGVASFINCHAVKRITIPNNVQTIGRQSMQNFYALSELIIPDSVTSCDDSAISQCNSLSKIVLSNNLTSISSSMFSKDYSIMHIVIPSSVTTINASAFGSCTSMAIYDFTSHTSVPTLSNANAFDGIPADCKIKVPAALYDSWITATNWVTYVDYIEAVNVDSNLITFMIHGTTYQAEEGMTWSQWCNSGYNTGNVYVDDDKVMIDDGNAVDGEINQAYASDTIIADQNYLIVYSEAPFSLR